MYGEVGVSMIYAIAQTQTSKINTTNIFLFYPWKTTELTFVYVFYNKRHIYLEAEKFSSFFMFNSHFDFFFVLYFPRQNED